MSKSIIRKSSFKLLYLAALAATVLWSAVILLSLFWSVHIERRQLATLVKHEARAHFNKDQAFRFWAASHGGVYVPVTEATPPNPNLSHVPERDLVTPSGRQLTLMNPAYMLRQMMEQFEELYGVKGRITSLQLFNPANAPDEWETKALRDFEKGVQEALEYTEIKGEPYLRLMRPMVTKRGCLKCHGYQGYQEGDIRGGVGIALPLTSYQKVSGKTVRHICFAYLLLWLVILPVIFLFFKKAQSRLKESVTNENKMKKWSRIFKHAQWGILVSDEEVSTLETINPAFADIHGFTVEELRDKPYLTLVAEDFRDDTVQQFTTAQKIGHHIFESRHIRKDGTSFPVELNVTAVRDSSKKIVEQIINAQDISARKEAENLIIQAHDEWRRTFNAIQEIVLILDPDLRVMKANITAEQRFNSSPGGLDGHNCFELFRKASSPCEGCPAVRAVRGFKPCSREIEHRNMGCFFLNSSSPVFDDSGNLTGIVCVAKDITQQKQLESKMHQAQKMEAIGTLAGGIAHDFNNILAPILGYSEMLTGSLATESMAGDQVRQIYNAALRARELVKQILGFSRQSKQALQPVEPHLIVKEALKLLRSSIPTSIEMKDNIDTRCGKIFSDPTQIHQVVVNLCTNAYQAMMEKGGTLGVAMKPLFLSVEDVIHKVDLKPGAYILIEVSDTGTGMAPDVLEKIFEPYFTTKKESGGTGLGLATVHAIVHEHGGALSVYSEPGLGTTFQVYFPKFNERKETTGQNSLSREQITTGTEHILVVDDEDAIAELIQSMLTQSGYRVTAQTDSIAAWGLFKQHPETFDLLVTDMAMPRMTGIELAKKVLLIKPDFPVILCTGFSEMINKEKAEAIGIREYLMKPVLNNRLAVSVRRALGDEE